MTQSSVNNKVLESFLDKYLDSKNIKDFTENGLQVEGKAHIKRIVTGVTASQELIDEAIKLKADAILVHHGYFWKGASPRIIGYHKERIAKLIKNDINLFAYHLPLDKHPEIGNNALLRKMLGLNELETDDLVTTGYFTKAMHKDDLAKKLEELMGRSILHISKNCPEMVEKVGICSGGGQGFIDQAYAMGCDAFISGEISEYTTHSAVEQGINYYMIGHHASERCGIRALGELVSKHFALEVIFVDCENPA